MVNGKSSRIETRRLEYMRADSPGFEAARQRSSRRPQLRKELRALRDRSSWRTGDFPLSPRASMKLVVNSIVAEDLKNWVRIIGC
jgi:hypothetical protein